MAAARPLRWLVAVLGLLAVAMSSPPAKPGTRRVPPETRDVRLRGGAQLEETRRDAESPMAREEKLTRNSTGGSSESRENETGPRDKEPKEAANPVGEHAVKKPLDVARGEGWEVSRSAGADQLESRRPAYGGNVRKPQFSGFSRLPKSPFRRGGADLQPRSELKPHVQLQPQRSSADEPTARNDLPLPVGKHELKSDNFPGNYAVNRQSVWNLRPQSGTASLTITCSDFRLENPAAKYGCIWDYVSINGRRFCGTNGPISITANWLKIVFKSDSTVVDKGFSCQVEVRDGCCGRSSAANRIVGGSEVTPPHALPWQVGLTRPKYGPGFVFCGGSVVNSRFVVTAAHCTDGLRPVNITVALGLHRVGDTEGVQLIPVLAIHQHSEYNVAAAFDNDISLLELADDIAFSDSVRPVCLPRGGDLYADAPALVSGWGTLSSGGRQPDVLHSVAVQTLTNARCGTAYGTSSITENMLCAAGSGKDSCQGDSGGPLVSMAGGRATQIGVVSFGRGCADPDYPGVYVRVMKLLEWIDEHALDGEVC